MLAGKIIRGVIWQLSGRIGGSLIGLASTLTVAYLISPDDFGVFALAMTVAHLSSAFLQLNTSLILIRMDEPTKEDFDTVFTFSLLRGLLLSLILAIAAWPFAAAFDEMRLFPLLLALTLYPFLLGIQNPYFELFAKDLRFAPKTILQLCMKVATFIGSVSVALIYASYWALYAGLIASVLVSLSYTFIAAKGRPGLSMKSWRKVFSFSSWLALDSIALESGKQFERLVIGAMFGTAVVGALALAGQIVRQLLESIIQPLNSTMYSALSHIRDEFERLKETYLLCQASYCALMLPTAVGFALVADEIVALFLADKWSQVALFAAFIAADSVAMAVPGPFRSLAMSLGRTRFLFIRSSIALVIRVTLQIIGLLNYGLIGLLMGGLIASAIDIIIGISVVGRLTQIPFVRLALNTVRPLCATALMAGAVLLVADNIGPNMPLYLNLALQVLAGAAVYFTSTWLIWRAAGEPDGPERFVLERAGTYWTKWRHQLNEG